MTYRVSGRKATGYEDVEELWSDEDIDEVFPPGDGTLVAVLHAEVRRLRQLLVQLFPHVDPAYCEPLYRELRTEFGENIAQEETE